MAVPDWPNTYGYNLFAYPWKTWLYGPWDLFIEHGHRLLGATVGLLTIGLCIAFWRGDSRPWAKWLGLVALAGVIVQGALGGMRVLFDERALARVHGSVGPAFFAYVTALVVVTSRRWRSGDVALATPAAGKFQHLALVTSVLAYFQLVIGAHLRHPSLTWSPAVFQSIVVFHLIFAAALAIHVLLLVFRATHMPQAPRTLLRTAALLASLLFAQLLLGGLTWLENYGWFFGAETRAIAAAHTVQAHSQLQTLVTTAHVAMGSLIVALSVVLTLRSFRWLKRVPRAAAATVPSRSLNGLLTLATATKVHT